MAESTNCLTDYIGLLGCSTTTPDSGVYVNELPGISLKMVDNTADNEQVTFAGVWADVQKRGTRKFFTDLTAQFSKRYNLKNITQAVDLTENIVTTTTTANAAKYRGAYVLLDNYTTNGYVSSNLQQINVQQISLYLSSSHNTTIKIFDAISGAQLFTNSLTGVQGWNTIDVYEKYTTRKLFICYDATLITGVNLDVFNTGCCDYTECGSWIYGGESALTSTVKDSGITRTNDTYGLSVCYDVQCNFDSFVCCHKEVFTNALLYLLGSQLLFELQYSPRINFYTTINAQKAKELRAEFDALYKFELEQAVDGIRLNSSDCCIECNDQVLIKENYG